MNIQTEKKRNMQKMKRIYKRRLKQLADIRIIDEFGIDMIFITYLSYLRDQLVFKYGVDPENKEINSYLLELVSALAEYSDAQSCFLKYFKKQGEDYVPAKEGEDEETAAKAYMADKWLHMHNFWYYVERDMDMWRHYVKLQ